MITAYSHESFVRFPMNLSTNSLVVGTDLEMVNVGDFESSILRTGKNSFDELYTLESSPVQI